MSVSECITAIATVVLVGVTAWYAWTTREILQQSRNAASSQMLHNLLSDYNSPEMHLALSALWAFRRACGDDHDFLDKYMDRYKTEFELLRGRPDGFRGTEVIRDSLDYQRRLVSGFYARLDALVETRMISKQDAGSYWDDEARMVLDKIVRPIEAELAKTHKIG
jgi:hypothetical protein